jgi:hypothetical protein
MPDVFIADSPGFTKGFIVAVPSIHFLFPLRAVTALMASSVINHHAFFIMSIS